MYMYNSSRMKPTDLCNQHGTDKNYGENGFTLLKNHIKQHCCEAKNQTNQNHTSQNQENAEHLLASYGCLCNSDIAWKP